LQKNVFAIHNVKCWHEKIALVAPPQRQRNVLVVNRTKALRKIRKDTQ